MLQQQPGQGPHVLPAGRLGARRMHVPLGVSEAAEDGPPCLVEQHMGGLDCPVADAYVVQVGDGCRQGGTEAGDHLDRGVSERRQVATTHSP